MECPGKTLSNFPACPYFHAWRLLQMDRQWDMWPLLSVAWEGHEWKWMRNPASFQLFLLRVAQGALLDALWIPAVPDLSRRCTACPRKQGFTGMAHTSSWEKVKNPTAVNGHHSLLSVAVVEKFKIRFSLWSHHLLAVVTSLYIIYFGAASVFT